jgi:hypothetical protein
VCVDHTPLPEYHSVYVHKEWMICTTHSWESSTQHTTTQDFNFYSILFLKKFCVLNLHLNWNVSYICIIKVWFSGWWMLLLGDQDQLHECATCAGVRKSAFRSICLKCVHMHVNAKMIPVETLPWIGEGAGEKREQWKGGIQVWYSWYIVRTL